MPPPIQYRKGELIGCGAFGHVYMGINLDSGELLAVKQVSFFIFVTVCFMILSGFSLFFVFGGQSDLGDCGIWVLISFVDSLIGFRLLMALILTLHLYVHCFLGVDWS